MSADSSIPFANAFAAMQHEGGYANVVAMARER